MRKYSFAIISLALCLIAYQLSVCWLPENCRTMQEDSFFLFTVDYFRSKLALQPAVTSWLSSLSVQLFRWPWLGALLQGIISWLTAVCLRSILPSGRWHWWGLSLLPSVILLLFWPLCVSLQIQVLALILLLVVFCRLPLWWERLVWGVIWLPLGYMLLNLPLLVVLCLLYAIFEWWLHKARGHVVVLDLLAACAFILPSIYSQRVAFIPFDKRYTYITNGESFPLWNEELRQQETYFRVLRAAEEERWADMRIAIRDGGKVRTRLMQKYLLLAESAMGTLPQNLFSYQINTPDEFFYAHERNLLACQINRLFYRNLGLYDEAFHHAQEYYLLFPDGCCFRSLTQMVDYSIREGEYAVAEKYLQILSHAPFYGRFVKEQRERIAHQQATVKIERPLRIDNFVGGYPFPSEMERLIRNTDIDNQKPFDYLCCALLLMKDLRLFMVVINAFPDLVPSPMPDAYAQAIQLYESQGEVPDEACVFGSYYYYFRNVAIPEPNARMRMSSSH